MKGYVEWIHDTEDMRMGFITNTFGRVLYINKDWPHGNYEAMQDKSMTLSKDMKERCVKGREFGQDDLLLELL